MLFRYRGCLCGGGGVVVVESPIMRYLGSPALELLTGVGRNPRCPGVPSPAPPQVQRSMPVVVEQAAVVTFFVVGLQRNSGLPRQSESDAQPGYTAELAAAAAAAVAGAISTGYGGELAIVACSSASRTSIGPRMTNRAAEVVSGSRRQ